MDFTSYLKSILSNFKSTDTAAAERELSEYIDSQQKPRPQLIQYDAPSDEQIAEQARNEAFDLNYAKDNLRAENDLQREKYERSAARAAEDLAFANAANDKKYNELREREANDSLARGMSRSSVANHRAEAVQNERAAAADKLYYDYLRDVEDINYALKTLEEKEKRALADLDLKYADSIKERIDELKAEREKKIEQTHKYNNELIAESMPTDEEREESYKNIYLKADELMSKMSSYEARRFVKTSAVLRRALSGYWYFKLYAKYAG